MIWLHVKVDPIFPYILPLLVILIILGASQAKSNKSLNFVFHLVGLILLGFFTLIGIFVIKSKPYFLMGSVFYCIIFQIAIFHQFSLIKNLANIPIEEWEKDFIHLSKYLLKRSKNCLLR